MWREAEGGGVRSGVLPGTARREGCSGTMQAEAAVQLHAAGQCKRMPPRRRCDARLDAAGGRREARGQRLRRAQRDRLGRLVARQEVLVADRCEDNEADVVSSRVELVDGEPLVERDRRLQPPRGARQAARERIVVEVEEGAREEARHPAAGVAQLPRRAARAGALHGVGRERRADLRERRVRLRHGVVEERSVRLARGAGASGSSQQQEHEPHSFFSLTLFFGCTGKCEWERRDRDATKARHEI